jgi:hypothetical protein
MVYALALGASLARDGSSSLPLPTKKHSFSERFFFSPNPLLLTTGAAFSSVPECSE